MSDKETTLISVEQKEVEFYGDELTAVRGEDGRIYVSVRHMCQALGVDDQGQRQRINRHTILARGLMVCNLHTIQGYRDGYVLRVDLVPLWLSGIRTSSVNEKSRPKLEKFQEESANVLWEAFQEGRLTVDQAFEELLQTDSPAVQAYKTFQALTKLARNQVLMEARLDDYGERLERVEAVLGDSARHITPDQATAVSQAVKAVALVMGKQTGKNEYGGVYNELYRRYRIPSYRELPAAKYEDAIEWLGEWFESLTGDEPFSGSGFFCGFAIFLDENAQNSIVLDFGSCAKHHMRNQMSDKPDIWHHPKGLF